MSIPGVNLLNMASSVIALETVQYHKNIGKIENAAGIDVPQYSAALNVEGSFQPVPRAKYEYLGLDFSKSYFNFFTSSCVLDLQRNANGDQFVFNSKRYQVETNTPWSGIDGWVQALCVEIPAC